MVASQFAHEVRPDRDRVIVSVTGELDLAGAADFKRTLDELLGAGFTRVVVDLRELSFMDSTGLQVLIGAHRALSTRDGRLSLVCNDGPVRRLLQLTATDALFAFDSAGSVR